MRRRPENTMFRTDEPDGGAGRKDVAVVHPGVTVRAFLAKQFVSRTVTHLRERSGEKNRRFHRQRQRQFLVKGN